MKAIVGIGRSVGKPRYLPWIGSAARSDDGVRWHVMGDSHYGNPDDADGYPDTPGITRLIVQDWALEQSRASAFFTRVASIVRNENPGSFDRREAWGDFAFSNFAQRLVPAPRHSPSDVVWQEARALFFGQLAITKPEVLIVLGSRAWQQLPTDVGTGLPAFSFDARPDWAPIQDAWFYPHWVDGKLIGTVAVKVVHPSAGGGHWNWQIAAERAHTTMFCHSNVLEWVADHCDLQHHDSDRPDRQSQIASA